MRTYLLLGPFVHKYVFEFENPQNHALFGQYFKGTSSYQKSEEWVFRLESSHSENDKFISFH